MSAPAACRIRVTGRVQGVFYRDWTVLTARAIGLAGWVRNRGDGSVEIVAEGAPAAIDALVAACREGSPDAVVDAISVAEVSVEHLDGFDKKPTF